MKSPSLDLIVFGATSFVGQILARYLFAQFGAHDGLKWALAGRSEQKLAAAAQLARAEGGALADRDRGRGRRGRARGTLRPDAGRDLDRGALRAVRRAAGQGLCRNRHGLLRPDRRGAVDPADDPRLREGRPQVGRPHRAQLRLRLDPVRPRRAFPAAAGDRALRRAVHARARCASRRCAAGSRAARSRACSTSSRRRRRIRRCARNSPIPIRSARRATRPRCASRTCKSAEFDDDFDAWVAPFVMSAINTRIVQRSNALSKQAYGADFTYDEAVLTGRGLKGRLAATGMAAGLGGLHGGRSRPADALGAGALRAARARRGPERGGTEDRLLRPALHRQDGGRPLDRVHASPAIATRGTARPPRCSARPAPAWRRTCATPASKGGFWTPATIFGDRLIARLTKHSGLTFEVLDDA